MTVLDIFNSISREDLALKIMKQHPYHFNKSNDFEKDKEYTLKALDTFYKDILSIIPYNKSDKEMEDYLDFCMVITNYYDDTTYDNIDVFDLDRNTFDFDKFDISKCDKYYCVEAIYLNQLKKNHKCLDLSFEEIKKIDDFENNHITTYGIDFLTRKIVLGMEVAQPCIDLYGLNVVAAELFWEMTFYGLKEEQIQEESHKLDKNVEEVEKGNIETITLEELFENEDNSSFHISKEDINFSIDFGYKVNEYNHKIQNEIFKKIYKWIK